MKRRDFVLKGTVLSLGGLAILRCRAEEISGSDDIGLQLYTVRDQMKLDPRDTLLKISKMGYSHVENAGYSEGKYYGMKQVDFVSVLNDLGLKMYSGHTMTGAESQSKTHTMTNQWEKACEDAARIDQEYIVLAYLIEEERKTIDDYKRISELCNKCGEIANSFGVKLAYHNHDFEFLELENKIPYDILIDEVDGDKMNFELDLYWTRKANVEGIEYINKHPKRFPLWHIKDMDDTEDRYFTEVGNGVIDWKKHFASKEVSGLKHFYVEQDMCKNHLPLESVKISIDNLIEMKLG